MTSSAGFEKLFASSKQINDSSGKTIIQCPGLSPVAFDLIMRYVCFLLNYNMLQVDLLIFCETEV
jgi:hypothetical protein